MQPPPAPPFPPPGLFLREEAVRRGAELIVRAQRVLADASAAALAEKGLGQAHHRALLLIARNPKIPVSGLQHLLRVRKQSLSPVLEELIARGLVVRVTASEDRRRRLLVLTPTGEALERALFARIRARLADAYRAAGVDAVAGFWQVLSVLAGEEPG